MSMLIFRVTLITAVMVMVTVAMVVTTMLGC